LVNDPFFNEPGWEKLRNSANGIQQSAQYNKNIQIATVNFAMLNTLKNPSPIFRDVITEHFRMKSLDILNKVNSWSHSNPQIRSTIPELQFLLQSIKKRDRDGAKESI